MPALFTLCRQVVSVEHNRLRLLQTHQSLKLCRWERPAEKITLHLFATVPGKEVILILRFNTFGNKHFPKIVTHCYRSGNNPRNVRVGGYTTDKRSVYLQFVYGKP